MAGVRATVADKLAGYGIWTYRGAWALEITASIIGLATGIALGYQAFSASSDASFSMELILASAPFFMVALAELTKIPVATVLFSASWIWKPVILIFMVLLAGITFETVFMGLERAATLRQLQYEDLRQKIDALKFEAESLRAADELAQETNFVSDAQQELSDVSTRAAAERQTIEDQLDAVDDEIAGQLMVSPEADRARDQLLDAKQDRTDRVAAHKTELDDAIRQFESQRDSFVQRIEVYAAAGDTEGVASTRKQLEALVNPRRAITARQTEEIRPYDERIAQLQAAYDKLLAASVPMTDGQRAALQDRRSAILARLDQVSVSWDERMTAAQERLASAQATEASKADTAAKSQFRQDAIAQEISGLEAQRIPLARQDQIRRIAGRFFGQKAENVTEDQADLVAVIWFGSLAGLAALAGPLTAIVALALQRIAARLDQPKAEGRLSKLIRRAITQRRWSRVRTIDRPVETKVEVEVEKRIEVPVEIEKVVKEILYVPILTDDPEMVISAMSKSLPPEVTDIVKSASKGGKRAGPAQHVPS